MKDIKKTVNNFLNSESEKDEDEDDGNIKETEKKIHDNKELVEKIDKKLVTENGKILLKD